MSYKKLLSAGGEPVGGKVYINRVEMGFFGSNGFELTEEGQRFLGAPAVAVVEPEPPAPAPKPKPRKEAAKPVSDLMSDLDNL